MYGLTSGDELTTSNALLKELHNGARKAQDVVKQLWDEAAHWEPTGFQGETKKLRAYYNSRGEGYTLAEKIRRYPKTYAQLPDHQSDTVRHVALQDATVFGDEFPNHWLSFESEEDEDTNVEGNENREPTPEEKERLQAWESLVEDSEVFDELQEAERWVRCARNCVLSVRYDSVYKSLTGEGRLVIKRYWADYVRWVPLWCATNDERFAVAILVKTSGPDNRVVDSSGVYTEEAEEWYEFWTREAEVKANGVEFGDWHAELVGTKSGATPLFGDGVYPLPTAPFLVWRDGRPDNSIYLDPGVVLAKTAANVDLAWSAHDHRLDFNGAQRLFFDDPELTGDDLVVGPGEGVALAKGTTVTAIGSDVDEVGLNTIKEKRRELALHRSQAPDAYDPEKGQGDSGFARKIKNVDRDRSHRNRVREAKHFLTKRLFPLLAEVWDYWENTGILFAKRSGTIPGEADVDQEVTFTPVGEKLQDVTFNVEFPRSDNYEDPESHDRRVMTRQEKGYISPQDAVVELRIADNEEDATRHLESFDSKLLKGQSLDAESEGALNEFGAALNGEEQAVENALEQDALEQELGAGESEEEENEEEEENNRPLPPRRPPPPPPNRRR